MTSQAIDTELANAHTLVTADLDGSGRDSVIAGETRGKRSVYLYSAQDDQGAQWDKEVLDDGTMSASGCAAADLNGDRRTDIVYIGGATGKLEVV